jgi:hypothetical protein
MLPVAIGLGAMGMYQQSQDQAANREAIKRQMDLINSVPLPVLKEYYPELYKQAVILNPQLEKDISAGPSAMESISMDPKLRQAQMNALARLEDIGTQGGMNAQDRARLAQIESEQAANVQGATGAIQQQMSTRGLSGGMSELVQKQLAAQQSANRAAQQGMDVKAQAEQRALDAIMQSGQLGGNIRGQDFGEQERIAQAKDLINRFNVEGSRGVQSRNVSGQNQAQFQNAQIAQQVANLSTEAQNQAQQRNLGLSQQQYENRLRKAGAQIPVMQSGLQNQIAGQQQRNQMIGGLVQAGAQYMGGYQSKPQAQDDNYAYNYQYDPNKRNA